MNLSDKGLALIQEFESYLKAQPDGSCKAYKCPAGVWTIGFGVTEGVTADSHFTRDEADNAFRREMEKHEKIVNRLVTVSITQCQFDALVSFNYNCGALASSTLLKKLNKRDYLGAADEFRYFTKARNPKTGKKDVLNGLVRRRKAESAMFTSDMPGADDMPQAAVESRPIGVIIKENKELVTTALGVVGVGGKIASDSASTPVVPTSKPDAKAQIAKAKETAKEVRENVEVAKDYLAWAKPTAMAAYENWMVVGPLVIVAGLAIGWPKIKERLSW